MSRSFSNGLDEYICLVANEIEHETPMEKNQMQSLGDNNQSINDLPSMRGGKIKMEIITAHSERESAEFENKAAN